jgi:hypothetical protein
VNVLDTIRAIWNWLSANWTAICVVLFNVEEKRVDDAKDKEENAKLELQLEKNKEIITNKYTNHSDNSIIREVIGSGGSEPEPGKPKKDS